MSDEDREKLEQWLSDQQWDGDTYGEDVTTPRDWLREAVKSALHGSKKPMGRRDWAYELAITMVPTYPDIVLDFRDNGGDDVEFTFDWERFDEILNGALDALINQCLDDDTK